MFSQRCLVEETHTCREYAHDNIDYVSTGVEKRIRSEKERRLCEQYQM